MAIILKKTPDIEVSATTLNRLRYEYQQAFMMYCGPVPDFDEWATAKLAKEGTK